MILLLTLHETRVGLFSFINFAYSILFTTALPGAWIQVFCCWKKLNFSSDRTAVNIWLRVGLGSQTNMLI